MLVRSQELQSLFNLNSLQNTEHAVILNMITAVTGLQRKKSFIMYVFDLQRILQIFFQDPKRLTNRFSGLGLT